MLKTFESGQAQQIVAYIKKKYARTPEYMWARSPDDAIWRRADNEKWFAGLFHVRESRLKPGAGDDRIEILNLRCMPVVAEMIVDKQKIFPGWHMNKRHWITIVLDGRMDIRQIYSLVDNSYTLASKK